MFWALPWFDAFGLAVAEDVDAPVVAVPPVALELAVELPPAPPSLCEIEPESELALLSEVDVVGPTRTLLSMGPTELPPLTRDCCCWALDAELELEPTLAGAVPAFCSAGACCAKAGVMVVKASARAQAAVVK
jgi:hypothetical protein